MNFTLTLRSIRGGPNTASIISVDYYMFLFHLSSVSLCSQQYQAFCVSDKFKHCIRFVVSSKLCVCERSVQKVPTFILLRTSGNTGKFRIFRYGLRGAHLSSSTACATGLHAVGDSATFIQMGRAKRMLAGATEACVNRIAITGFKQMRWLVKK